MSCSLLCRSGDDLLACSMEQTKGSHSQHKRRVREGRAVQWTRRIMKILQSVEFSSGQSRLTHQHPSRLVVDLLTSIPPHPTGHCVVHSSSAMDTVHPHPIPASQSCALAAQNVMFLSATSTSSLGGGTTTGLILNIGRPTGEVVPLE